MMQKRLPEHVFDKLSLEDQVVECFWKRASELTKVIFYSLNAAFPTKERLKNPKLDYLYQDAFQQAKFHRNHHKNVVKEAIVPLAKIKKHAAPYDPEEIDKATIEFRKLILAQYDMLYTRFVNYADLLIPSNGLAEFLITLERVYKHERGLLEREAPPNGISHYSVTPKYEKESDFLPQEVVFQNLNAARKYYGKPEVNSPVVVE